MGITERYCSYEVARLLHEKGFDIWRDTYFTHFGTFGYNLHKKDIDLTFACYAPTQQMACDWVFEKCKYCITLEYDGCIGCWECHIRHVDKPNSHFIFTGMTNKEEAINDAILYVLNNFKPKE